MDQLGLNNLRIETGRGIEGGSGMTKGEAEPRPSSEMT
jgi:hypothetical protein